MITLSGGSLKGVLALASNQGYTSICWASQKGGVWTIGGLGYQSPSVDQLMLTRCTMLRDNVSYDGRRS